MSLSVTPSIYPLQELFPFSQYEVMKKNYAVHFMIVHGQAAKNITWIQKRTLEELERPDPTYHLTPLHLAVMKGDRQMVQFLLEKKVSLTSLDIRSYTVLHHAVICQNSEIEQWIQTADKTAQLVTMKTDSGKTADDLALLLAHQPAKSDQPVFNYFDANTQQMVYGATAEKFKEMTGANYTSHLLTTPKALVNNLLSSLVIDEVKTDLLAECQILYLQDAYQTYLKSPPMIYMGQDSHFSAGYDIYAGQDLVPGQVVTTYLGQEVENPPNDTAYLMKQIDGKAVRNLGPMINDSFPNLAFYTFPSPEGTGNEYMFIALCPIKKGEKLFFDYGKNYDLKWKKHIEMNIPGLEEFFKRRSLLESVTQELFPLGEKLIQQKKKLNPCDKDYQTHKCELGRSWIMELNPIDICIKYIFYTPSTLLYLLAKKIIQPAECLKILTSQQSIIWLNLEEYLPLIQKCVMDFKDCQDKATRHQWDTQFQDVIIEMISTYQLRTIIFLSLEVLKKEMELKRFQDWEKAIAQVKSLSDKMDHIYSKLEQIKVLNQQNTKDPNINELIQQIILLAKEFPKNYKHIVQQILDGYSSLFKISQLKSIFSNVN